MKKKGANGLNFRSASELLPQFEHIMQTSRQKSLFQMQISAGVFRRAFSSAQVSSREEKKNTGRVS